MKYFLNRTTLTFVAVGMSVLIGINSETQAQNDVVVSGVKTSETQPLSIKTLDDVRKLKTDRDGISFVASAGMPGVSGGYSGGGGGSAGMSNGEGFFGGDGPIPGSKNWWIDRNRDLQLALSKPGEDRTKTEQVLRLALTEYFIRDMQVRVKELDEIKAKVAETEAKLQKRLDIQKEAIDLQMQIMIREADGLGFFATASTAGSSVAIVQGSPDAWFSPNKSGASVGPASGKEVPVAATLPALTEILSTTQSLALIVDNDIWYRYRLPASFDDEAFKSLAEAILKVLGAETGSERLRWARDTATLTIRLTTAQYELGNRIPDVIEKLKESSDLRQKQKNEAATNKLLGR